MPLLNDEKSIYLGLPSLPVDDLRHLDIHRRPIIVLDISDLNVFGKCGENTRCLKTIVDEFHEATPSLNCRGRQHTRAASDRLTPLPPRHDRAYQKSNRAHAYTRFAPRLNASSTSACPIPRLAPVTKICNGAGCERAPASWLLQNS